MTILKYILIGFVLIIAAAIDAGLKYITPPFVDSFFDWPFLQKIFEWLSANPFITAVVVRIIWISQVVLGIFLYPRRYIRERNKKIIRHIYLNLFSGDIQQYRVTLFKEICYLHALWRYVCALGYHCRVKYFSRFILHCLSFPSPGRYLIIDFREGAFPKSRTMFRVEDDALDNCEGIVGIIRFQKGSGTVLSDLPNITNINLDRVDLSNQRKNETKDVLEYMSKGYIKDMNTLKLLHLRARHFLGSVIYKKDGNPWGLILVDSVAGNNPFENITVDKFKIYSEILTDLVS